MLSIGATESAAIFELSWLIKVLTQGKALNVKALANEDTLLRTHCCSWCFLGYANWETFVADTKWTKSETFYGSRTQNVCSQQMLRARVNGETFVSATMCPRLPGPLASDLVWNVSSIWYVVETTTLINRRIHLEHMVVLFLREKYHKESKKLSETNIKLFEVIKEVTERRYIHAPPTSRSAH